jgi:hypothetical protein
MKILNWTFLALFISACAAPETQVNPQAAQETAFAMAWTTVAQTQASMPTTLPTETMLPPATETPSSVFKQGDTRKYSWNYLGSIDSGGVAITIGRVVIAEKDAMAIDFSKGKIFDDKPVVAEVMFIIENKTSGMISVYPDQGKIMVGSEQINMMDFSFAGTSVGGVYSGDILPGAKLIGGLWVGFQRTPLNDINSMTIFINAPHDKDFNSLGQDYTFNLDLSQKQFVEYPAEFPK